MMKRLNVFVAILAGFFGISTNGTAQENSLLWSVTGNGLKDTSYIFGTMHMMCEKDFEMKPKVKSAFAGCDQVFLEIDMDDEKEMAAMLGAAMGEKPLTEILSPEQQKRLDEKLKAELGMTLSAVNQYSLITISSLLMMNNMKCGTIKSFEQEFMAMAAEKEIELKGLEKVAFQMECLNKSAGKDEAFEDLFDQSLVAVIDTLVKSYNEEDLTAMKALFSGNDYMDENAREWLLKKRNTNWVKAMPKIMKKKPTFFAVGTAHLLYDYGILELLKAEGYTLTPVLD